MSEKTSQILYESRNTNSEFENKEDNYEYLVSYEKGEFAEQDFECEYQDEGDLDEDEYDEDDVSGKVKAKSVRSTVSKERSRKTVPFGIADDGDDEETKKARKTASRESKTTEMTEERRRTIYQLDSYQPWVTKDESYVEDNHLASKKTVARYSTSLGLSGIVRVYLSPLTQKIIGCVIDENVTTEFPWIYVHKEIIEDNLDLHSESSDFLAIKEEIKQFDAAKILLGYAPSVTEEGQFYVCVTHEAHDEMAKRMEARRLEQRQKVQNSLNKVPRAWKDLGSSEVVDAGIVKTSRPLYEIEVESTINQLKAAGAISLSDSACDSQRDCCVEIVPTRETFNNVSRLQVDKEIKAIAEVKEVAAQTVISHCTSASIQCQLDCEATGVAVIKPRYNWSGLVYKAEQAVEQVHENTTWDVYANDYAKLSELTNSKSAAARAATATTKTPTAAAAAAAAAEAAATTAVKQDNKTEKLKYIEQKSYYDGKLCGGRVINDLSWHPLWTGIAAVAYTVTSKSENLIGPPKSRDDLTIGEGNQVLVWSFDNSLRPKLVLECGREVTAVSFCPQNGNIVIGGCRNGQIVIWDITDKIAESELITISGASTDVKNATMMRSLVGDWMKEPKPSSMYIKATAVSSLEYSQKAPITKIEWLPLYDRIDERGRLHRLKALHSEDDFNLQFCASCEDGSIAFWDLKWRPLEDKKSTQAHSEKKGIKKPESLMKSISPYKILNDTFKPIYVLIIQYVNDTRNAIITAISLRKVQLAKVQVEPFPKREADITERKCYRLAVEFSERDEEVKSEKEKGTDNGNEEDLKPEAIGLFVCTARGECGIVTWEGYDFSTGISLNREIGKWVWAKQIHDGPISHAVRSQYLSNVVLTVGGRVFGIWQDDFAEPIFWRKSEFRYTACSWDTSKPSVIILGRNDGTMEIWDISIKSHEPNIIQSLSGRIITGVYAHELPLKPSQCVGFCDYNGALRIFLAPDTYSSADADWMRSFVEREVKRIKDFQKWQRERMEMSTAQLEEGEENEEGQQRDDAKKATGKAADAKSQIKDETAAADAAKIEAERKAKAKKLKNLIEEMRGRWVTRELQRMERAILTKKGLREEELEKRREPVLRMKREAREREARFKGVIDKAGELFEDAVTANFPHNRHKLLAPSKQLLAATSGDLASLHTVRTTDSGSLEDEIIRNYEDIENEALSTIRRKSQELSFSWRNLIIEGIKRRRSMDINMRMHRAKPRADQMCDGKSGGGSSADQLDDEQSVSTSLQSFK